MNVNQIHAVLERNYFKMVHVPWINVLNEKRNLKMGVNASHVLSLKDLKMKVSLVDQMLVI